MKHLSYLLLLLASAFLLGVSIYSASVIGRLFFWTRSRKWLWHLLVKVGFILTSSVLVYTLAPHELTQPVTARQWWYLLGLICSGVGVLGVGRYIAEHDFLDEEVRRKTLKE